MATRRGRNRPTEPPPVPSPPPEPVVESEPKNYELEMQPEYISDKEVGKSSNTETLERLKSPEKIIERIIILPGAQNSYQPATKSPCGTMTHHFHPPPLPAMFNVKEGSEKKKKKKLKRKKYEDKSNGDVNKEKPLYPPQRQVNCCCCNDKPAPTPVIVYEHPITCCCQKSSFKDTDEDLEEEGEDLVEPDSFISFANMVFAAANIMSEYPVAY